VLGSEGIIALARPASFTHMVFSRDMRVNPALKIVCFLVFAGVAAAVRVEAVRSKKNHGIVSADTTIQDGAAVPTSSTTVIAQQSDFEPNSDSVLDRVGTITFGDDDLQSNNDNVRQSIRAAPLTANDDENQAPRLRRSTVTSDSEQIKWGDPEAFNQRAIHRVAADIPDLLKKVDQAIPMYTRRVLTDYYDVANAIYSHERPSHAEDESVSFLEVSATEAEEIARFQSMDLQDRLQMLARKRYDLERLRDSIQSELAETSRLQSRIAASARDPDVPILHRSSPPSAASELQVSEQLTSVNPQLKEWADDARFTQSKREINSLLDKSSEFLESFKRRLATDYAV
jgi:hypothetical protein